MSKEDQVLKALEKFESKIDKLDIRMDSMERVLIKQEANIEYHVKRTDVAEANLDLLRNDLKPVQKHVDYMNGALKALGIVGAIVGTVAAIVETIHLFR